MAEIQNRPNLQLKVVVASAAVIPRYGDLRGIIEADGFDVSGSAHTLIEGETPLTMAQSVGLGTVSLSGILQTIQPDITVAVGDRFDVLSWVIASAMMNIPIAHTMGGERSGTIDESIRHAITKFANIHFPASSDAYERIVRMGEDETNVHLTGCPRIDYLKHSTDESAGQINDSHADIFERFQGVGQPFSVKKEKFLLVSFHPVTTEYGTNGQYVVEILAALQNIGLKVIMLWPNADAGSGEIAKQIRVYRENNDTSWLTMFVNLPIDVYNYLMSHCLCIIGNSSSAIREGEFLGTPVVNIGSRQNQRQMGANVKNVNNDRAEIFSAVQNQIEHGRYKSEFIYGQGDAARKIVDEIEKFDFRKVQKINTY